MSIQHIIDRIRGKKAVVDDRAEAIQALTAFVSLPQWPDLEDVFASRREQWVQDTKSAAVYRDHAELVHVNARIAECDYWLDILAAAKAKVTEPDPSP